MHRSAGFPHEASTAIILLTNPAPSREQFSIRAPQSWSTPMKFEKPKCSPGGSNYLLVKFGDDMSLELNFLALGLDKALAESGNSCIIDTVACYNSLLIEYDYDKISLADLEREALSLAEDLGGSDSLVINSRLVYLPTMYLDPWTRSCQDEYFEMIHETREYDADYIARINGLSDANHLVRVHSGSEYWAVTVGGLPGLPLLRPLDPRCRLSAPKYNPPRTWTTLGSVALGGASSAIYTIPAPGGYRIFARTPIPVWDPRRRLPAFRDSIVLLNPADRVRFVPIDQEEYLAIERQVEEGTYIHNSIDYQAFSVKEYYTWLSNVDSLQRF